MSDIFDLFDSEPPNYSAALWLWKTTQGLTVLGGPPHQSPEAAEAALRTYTNLNLQFIRVSHEGDAFANTTYEQRLDLAVVSRKDGIVVSYASLPEGFRRP